MLRSTQTRGLSAARDATLSMPVLFMLMRWPCASAMPAIPAPPALPGRLGQTAFRGRDVAGTGIPVASDHRLARLVFGPLR